MKGAREHPQEVLVLPAHAVHPIAPSARGLSELFVGEDHEIPPPLAERLDPNAPVGDAADRVEALAARLEASGVRVTWTPTGPHLGRFRAVSGRDARR